MEPVNKNTRLPDAFIENIDYTKSLPPEILSEIFSHLEAVDLENTIRVNSIWKNVTISKVNIENKKEVLNNIDTLLSYVKRTKKEHYKKLITELEKYKNYITNQNNETSLVKITQSFFKVKERLISLLIHLDFHDLEALHLIAKKNPNEIPDLLKVAIPIAYVEKIFEKNLSDPLRNLEILSSACDQLVYLKEFDRAYVNWQKLPNDSGYKEQSLFRLIEALLEEEDKTHAVNLLNHIDETFKPAASLHLYYKLLTEHDSEATQEILENLPPAVRDEIYNAAILRTDSLQDAYLYSLKIENPEKYKTTLDTLYEQMVEHLDPQTAVSIAYLIQDEPLKQSVLKKLEEQK